MTSLADVFAADVVICVGPGGVGKTTTAAALGIAAAGRGRRAVVVTIDPARRLGDALGLAGGLGATPQRIDLDRFGDGGDRAAADADGDGGGELWALMLDPATAFTRLIEREADAEQAARIVGNALFRNMVDSLSGTQEFMAAETLHELAGDDRFDLVIVDTPPTRNALDFLDAPGVLVRFLDHKLFRLIMLPARSGIRLLGAASQPLLKAIGKVVGSDVLSDVVAFFQAFAGLEGGFRRRADEVSALLRSPRTRYVLVAAPRTEALAEAAWFAGELAEQGIGGAAGNDRLVAVLNRTTPSFGAGDADDAERRAAAAADLDEAAAWTNLAELRRARAAELAAVAEHAALGPVAATIPLLPGDVHDLDGLRHVVAELFPPDRAPGDGER